MSSQGASNKADQLGSHPISDQGDRHQQEAHTAKDAKDSQEAIHQEGAPEVSCCFTKEDGTVACPGVPSVGDGTHDSSLPDVVGCSKHGYDCDTS